MSDLRVSALFLHPLKSAAPLAVEKLALDKLGAVNDRRWMLVGDDGIAITQRDAPRLALVMPTVSEVALTLEAPTLGTLRMPHDAFATAVREAIVWDDVVHVHDAGDEASAWCSEAIGISCRLVHNAESSPRPLQARYAGVVPPDGRRVALSDGAPLLLLGEGSLSTLNARLIAGGDSVLGVERFRPNVLLAGTSPHEEDTWHAISIGNVEVGVGSSCVRCVVTTTNQVTTERGVEPLRTLATYRKGTRGVMFGVNATNAHAGIIRLGDRVIVHATKAVVRELVDALECASHAVHQLRDLCFGYDERR